jgi:hypothetical protein
MPDSLRGEDPTPDDQDGSPSLDLRPRLRIIPVRLCDGDCFEIWIPSQGSDQPDREPPPKAA